jgi:hypothetical protein
MAYKHRGPQNVFFLPASNYAAFQKAFNEMAQIVGHDILKDRYSYPELHQVWLNLGESGQAREFKAWLSSEENRDSIIILDDLDGLREDRVILECLPDGDKSVIYSARDPTLATSRRLQSRSVLVPSMDHADMRALLDVEMNFHGVIVTPEEIEQVLSIVDGHPLAASRAVSYMKQLDIEASSAEGASSVQTFIDIFKSHDWKTRNEFLKHKIHFGPSIEEIFKVSIERLDVAKKAATLQFLEALGFICGSEPLVDYHNFLSIRRPWLASLKTRIPDCELFVSGMKGKNSLLQELEKVSLVFRPVPGQSLLRFHPIWLECIRQHCGPDGRQHWLKQILLICYETEKENSANLGILDLYIANCFSIASKFDIQPESLVAMKEFRSWIMSKKVALLGSDLGLGSLRAYPGGYPTGKNHSVGSSSETRYPVFNRVFWKNVFKP